MFSVREPYTIRLTLRGFAHIAAFSTLLAAAFVAGCGDADRAGSAAAGRQVGMNGAAGPPGGCGAVTAGGARHAPAAPITVEGDDGVRVTLDRPARRVVSLIPGRTDAIIALGAADRLAARTRYDEDPRIADLPSLQDALTPSVEWLLEQRPDLVIAWPDRQSRSVVTRLRELGIPVYASNVETIEDTRRAVTALGRLLGCEAAADSILSALDATIERVRLAVTGLPRIRVLYLIGIDPPMTTGSGTFVDEMITMAGGDNVFHDAATRWPPVSLEQIIARQPDLVLIAVASSPAAAIERLRAMPGMMSVRAIRDEHVRVLDATRFNRPGPSIIEALPLLATAIHPEAGLR